MYINCINYESVIVVIASWEIQSHRPILLTRRWFPSVGVRIDSCQVSVLKRPWWTTLWRRGDDAATNRGYDWYNWQGYGTRVGFHWLFLRRISDLVSVVSLFLLSLKPWLEPTITMTKPSVNHYSPVWSKISHEGGAPLLLVVALPEAPVLFPPTASWELNG